MSGTYMGKYWDGIEYFFKLYEVEDVKTIFYIMKMYENKIVNYKAEEKVKNEKQKNVNLKAVEKITPIM